MNTHIVLFGAGKSSTYLIDYLITQCGIYNWRLTVADTNLALVQSKIFGSVSATALGISADDEPQRAGLIQSGDLIISLLPPTLHLLVAKDCLKYHKNLLTASYIDKEIAELANEVKKNNLLFLFEMGLDPGIDHMSAMQLIHRIKSLHVVITSFRSHCGGLVAPESDDNPWHYKISWNPRNIVLAGLAGATYKQENRSLHVDYDQIFEDCREIYISSLGNLAFYPNRDSLKYISLYNLQEAGTFLRTTLRRTEFCTAWKSIVRARLTNATETVNRDALTFKQWSRQILPFVNNENIRQLEYLGLFDDSTVPDNLSSSADILQYLLESRLTMQPQDKDMVVMMHEISYQIKGETNSVESTLIVKGQDDVHTAMAKTVGLPLGIATKLILQKKITLTGLHIPILPEIYEPVLKELAQEGIRFEEIKISSK